MFVSLLVVLYSQFALLLGEETLLWWSFPFRWMSWRRSAKSSRISYSSWNKTWPTQQQSWSCGLCRLRVSGGAKTAHGHPRGVATFSESVVRVSQGERVWKSLWYSVSIACLAGMPRLWSSSTQRGPTRKLKRGNLYDRVYRWDKE